VVTSAKRRRYELVRRLGIEPTITARLTATIGPAVDAAAARSPGDVTVLDAGCGRASPLVTYRDRIDRFVGVDIHTPVTPLPYLDEFARIDLCAAGTSFGEAEFELVLSNFTLEHFADPAAALANLHRWLRPGGTLVLTTVNRRHPFVNAYLSFPDGARRRIQPLIKEMEADAHPLVGACNDPEAVVAALAASGFEQIELETVGNLARAWGRRWATFAVGLAGDVIAQGSPSRRSTILASAVKPAQSAAP
jgi:SAM-dependent methyltransferase